MLLLFPLCAPPNPLTPNPTIFMSKQINDEKMDFITDILGIKTAMGVEQLRAALECVQLFDTKQQDYGSSNISAGGELGIAVRLQDKCSRMKHLVMMEVKGSGIPRQHESMEDTYKDAANYAMIGLLLRRNRWK